MALADTLIVASQWGILSPTGKIRAFDGGADGFVRGEGCGLVVLKRLRAAEADGDRVLGVILGSAVNQDGASSGLTVPNGIAQQALLREAHRRAGIEPWQVSYVEAHGTGTTLGDPIEAEALGAVFAGREQKLAIGSVKTNIGHLESAAGVAGLIKVVLGLAKGEIPAQLHWTQPSPHLRWEELPLEVVSEARPWPAIGGRRIAGVSSFGFSGTNAHVIVEESAKPRGAPENGPHQDVLVITARTGSALRELASRYAGTLESSEAAWSEICYTAGVGRATLSERLAVVAGSRQEAAAQLRAWLGGEGAEGVYRGSVGAGHRGNRRVASDVPPLDLAAAFVEGAVVDWRERVGSARPARVALPTYAFDHQSYWIGEPRPGRAVSGIPTGQAMLGRRLAVAGVQAQYETLLSTAGWIGEHAVQGQAVLPMTGHLELMLEAGAELGAGGWVLEEVVLQTRLTVDGERRVQTAVEDQRGERSRVRIYAERESNWEPVSEGWLRAPAPAVPPAQDLEPIRMRLREQPGGAAFYARMAERGMRFGERFRGVQRLWTGEGEALGEIVSAEWPDGQGWQLEPWWLDACLQVAGASMEVDGLFLPVSLERLEVYGHPEPVSWSHVRTRRLDADTISADIEIFAPDGASIARLSALRFRRVRPTGARIGLYANTRMEFEPQPTGELRGHWLILSHDESLGSKTEQLLRAHGATCSVFSGSNLDEPAVRRMLRSIVADHGTLHGIVDLRAAERPDAIDPVAACTETLVLLQSLVREQARPTRGVWLVTRNVPENLQLSASSNAVEALGRTAALEFQELSLRSVELDAEATAEQLLVCLGTSEPSEISIVTGRFFRNELNEIPVHAMPEPVELVPAPSGQIEELQEVPVGRQTPKPDEIEIAVRAHGVNFRDVLNALRMLPGLPQRLGGECAGTVVNAGATSGFASGDQVFAFAPGCFRSYVTVKGTNAARIPPALTPQQAAALPVVYMTALCGLDRLASLQAGETVLIHSAAGGLGLAAVAVAKARGATIFATAGTEEKRAWLESLGVTRAMSSRTPAFADEILRLTQGRGVGVVLNSLTGELAERTLAIVAQGGRFLEVGKRDTLSATVVLQMRPDVRHFAYDLGELAERDPSLVPALLAEILRMLHDGTIAPLPVTEFADAKEAFRTMAQARHTGKLVVTRAQPARSFTRFDGEATWMITGGLGGLGLILAEALAASGARNLVLVGRKPPSSSATAVIERMSSGGVMVTIAQADVADKAAIESVLTAVPADRPLRGIFHCAGVIDDHSLLEQNEASLRAVMRPKWQGAWNLHTLTQDQPLELFVLFSSAAAPLGSPGQANYAAANSTLDALAVHRRACGLPALSIQWGPWNAAGMTEHKKTDVDRLGLGFIEPVDGVQAFEELLKSEYPVAAVLPVVSLERLRRQSKAAFTRSAPDEPRVSPGSAQTGSAPLLAELRAATPGVRREKLGEHLRRQTKQILSLPENTAIDEDEALHDIGLDSLMAVELRNSLSASLGTQLSPTLVLDYPTLRTLTDCLLAELFGQPAHEGSGTPDDTTTLSDAEAEAQLLEELGRQEHGARR
jgi:phthiocerol/phenolphthiocerol synthesis type-I polyketide synthase C